VDYKIASKAIATRITTILPNIINPDQYGYVRGRYIGEAIRTVKDLMFYTDIKNENGTLLCIDFKNAFDSLEWDFLFKSLRKFNFGESLTSWLKLFYCNISSCVLNNGFSCQYFELYRGGETRRSPVPIPVYIMYGNICQSHKTER
jgi:hypothetical protein